MIESLLEKINELAIARYPMEMCGVIIDGDFIELENVAMDRLNSFCFDPLEYRKYLECDAIIHSHTIKEGQCYKLDIRTPSRADYIGQKRSGKPWYIIGTNGEHCLPPIRLPRIRSKEYLGRHFMWYINDCYTLVQDYYYHEYGIELLGHADEFDYNQIIPEIDRGRIEETGFISRNHIGDIKNGELILISYRGGESNHLGIFHNDKIIHQDIISREEPFLRFYGRIDSVLTYKDFL